MLYGLRSVTNHFCTQKKYKQKKPNKKKQYKKENKTQNKKNKKKITENPLPCGQYMGIYP